MVIRAPPPTVPSKPSELRVRQGNSSNEFGGVTTKLSSSSSSSPLPSFTDDSCLRHHQQQQPQPEQRPEHCSSSLLPPPPIPARPHQQKVAGDSLVSSLPSEGHPSKLVRQHIICGGGRQIPPPAAGRLSMARNARPFTGGIILSPGARCILYSTQGLLSSWDLLSGECHWAVPLSSSGGLDPITSVVSVPVSFANGTADSLLPPLLLVGTSLGRLHIISALTGRTERTINGTSSRPIRHLLLGSESVREVWAIDEEGWLHRWALSSPSPSTTTTTTTTARDLCRAETKVGVLRVLPGATQATIDNQGQLWLAAGTIMEVHQANLCSLLGRFDLVDDLGMDVGPIMGIIAQNQTILTVHADGALIQWRPTDCHPLSIHGLSGGGNAVLGEAGGTGANGGSFGVSGKLKVVTSSRGPDDSCHLWLGWTSGRIQIVHLPRRGEGLPELWCDWKAHTNPICSLIACKVAILSSQSYPPMVVSTCEGGAVSTWEGSLQDRFVERLLENNSHKYAMMHSMKVRICSWNVDAQGPPGDESFWRNWLLGKPTGGSSASISSFGNQQSSVEPDLVVMGLQEIINLESASSNARLLLRDASATAATNGINGLSLGVASSVNGGNSGDDNPAIAQAWIEQALSFLGSDRWCLLAQRNMVGLLLVVFVRRPYVFPSSEGEAHGYASQGEDSKRDGNGDGYRGEAGTETENEYKDKHLGLGSKHESVNGCGSIKEEDCVKSKIHHANPLPLVHHLAMDVVKNGLNGLHGNKGAIAMRLLWGDTSLCLLNCHLAAGHAQVTARNADAANILRTTSFPRLAHCQAALAGGDGHGVEDHEHVVLFGDLNYRLGLSREEGEALWAQGEWEALLAQDQLRQQRRVSGWPLLAFNEGPIKFGPTYKFDRGSGQLDSGEKRRVPAYCDRILFRSYASRGDPAQVLEYVALPDMQISDHRPIAATLVLPVKVIDWRQRELLRLRIMQDLLTK